MPQDIWTKGSDAYLADLPGRREALRQAAAMPGADPRSLLDAAFAELDAAVEALTKLTETAADQSAETATPDPLSAERVLLRAVFQHAPVPLFVLEQDATVRRANGRAGDLIGAPPGYATGKALTAFVDLASRAVVSSQLAAAAQTGTPRQMECPAARPGRTSRGGPHRARHRAAGRHAAAGGLRGQSRPGGTGGPNRSGGAARPG